MKTCALCNENVRLVRKPDGDLIRFNVPSPPSADTGRGVLFLHELTPADDGLCYYHHKESLDLKPGRSNIIEYQPEPEPLLIYGDIPEQLYRSKARGFLNI